MLGREQRFPQASSWPVEMLTSQVGSSQGEALPGFTPLNLRDVSLSRRSTSTERRTRLPVPGYMNAPPTAAGKTQRRFVKNSQETALGAPPRLGPPALGPAPRCFARRLGHQPPGYWNGRADCARPPAHTVLCKRNYLVATQDFTLGQGKYTFLLSLDSHAFRVRGRSLLLNLRPE